MTEIEALLARLKELDPKTWGRLDSDVQIQTRNWSNIGNPRILWLVQGVIQEAIAAHPEWGCQQGFGNESLYKWAYIFREEEKETILGEGDTPAEALLRAYIAALEAEASR